MSKHTPGPWIVRNTGAVGTNDMMVANIYPMENENLEEHVANAKLIAAAPELLEALIAITNDSVCIKSAIVEQARAAIYKAIGEVKCATNF